MNISDKQIGEIFCTQCGQRNLPASRFCQRCGAQLNAAPFEKAEESHLKSTRKPLSENWLVVVVGVIAGLIAIYAFASANIIPGLKAFFEGLPAGARESLDQFFTDERRENPGFSYRITSAQQGSKPDFESGLIGALRNGYDEVWCVVIDPPITVFWGFIIRDGVDHFVIRRKGNSWQVYTAIPTLDVFRAAGCGNW